jgi:acetyl-CoA C-acetyltransferase
MTPPAEDEPILVGTGQVVHRPDDGPVPTLVELMTCAARRAGEDAGADALLAELGWVGAPKGAWTHPDPGREVATAVGAPRAHTVLAEAGITQQEVLDAALSAVRGGAAAALVVGAEAHHGSTVGAAGAVAEARQATVEPDEHLVTHDLGISPVELNHRFVDPPTVYAVLEDAVARAQGDDDVAQRHRLGRLTESFAAVAAGNPYAWDRTAPSGAAIVEPSEGNRMVAEPYTKLCCSNLRVNQGAALLVTTVGRARAAGVDEEQWVFCRGSAVANHAVPVIRRAELHRSPVASGAGQRALELAGVGADGLDHVDLYSCFPAAVQIIARELDLPLDRQLTVTGGMTFAGGPLNSYVLHALATMAGVVRHDPGSTGLVTSISGFLTKFGASVWSTTPAAGGWRGEDVTDAVRAVDRPRGDSDEPGGDAWVVAGTVTHARDGARTAIEVVETREGLRSVRSTALP